MIAFATGTFLAGMAIGVVGIILLIACLAMLEEAGGNVSATPDRLPDVYDRMRVDMVMKELKTMREEVETLKDKMYELED